MQPILPDISTISETTRKNIHNGSINLEELDYLFQKDIKIIYQIYKALRDREYSREEINSVFLRDIKAIYHRFMDMRGQLRLHGQKANGPDEYRN